MSFWRRCHEQLEADGAEPGPAHQFFRAQADTVSPDSEDPVELRERRLLLCMAAHWLSRLRPQPLEQLEALEKEVWLLRVRQRALAVAMETASVFRPPPPPPSAYEALLREFAVADLPCLNTDACLRLEGLPGAAAPPALPPEEARVLSALIGRLLDEGGVREASRVCRYFSQHHPDVWVALRCRALASGELSPEEAEPEEAEPQGRSLPTCKPRPLPPPLGSAGPLI